MNINHILYVIVKIVDESREYILNHIIYNNDNWTILWNKKPRKNEKDGTRR